MDGDNIYSLDGHPRRERVYCNFCGRRQDKVKALVAGMTAYICDECVSRCAEIVRAAMPSDGTPV